MKHWKLLASTALLGTLLAAPAYADTAIYYNDQLLNTTQPVEIVNNRTMLALRDLFESMDTPVDWDDAQRMVSLSYRDKHIQMFPDTGVVQVNGVSQALDVKPQIICDRVYLPIRFMAQTLGGTVDYIPYDDGNALIEIYSADSAKNYVQKTGKITKILREAKSPEDSVLPTQETMNASNEWKNHNTCYLFDAKGNLVELQSLDKSFSVNIIDLTNFRLNTSLVPSPQVYAPLYGTTITGSNVQIPLEQTLNPHYVGVGSPESASPYTFIHCNDGEEYPLYLSSKETKSLLFNMGNDTAYTATISESGYALELAGYDNSLRTDYLKDLAGNYAFRIGSKLLFVDSKTQLKSEMELTGNPDKVKFLSNSKEFATLYVNTEDEYPDLFLATYKEVPGFAPKTSLENITRLYNVADGETFYPYNYMVLIDAAMDSNKVYALVKTDMDYYLVTYSLEDRKITKEKLRITEPLYTQFIDTVTDGIKLFGVEKNYYYLRDID